MKQFILIAAMVMTTTSAAMAADPVIGLYKTQPGDDGNYGHVETANAAKRFAA